MDATEYMKYLDMKYEGRHSPDETIQKRKLKVNDIISFKFEKSKKKDPLFHNRVPRSISTYGHIAIPPTEDKKWKIFKIANSIPNRKGNFYYKADGKSSSRFIMVEPFDETYNDHYRVFWFIDEKDLTIRQFEDGCIIKKLSCIQDHI